MQSTARPAWAAGRGAVCAAARARGPPCSASTRPVPAPQRPSRPSWLRGAAPGGVPPCAVIGGGAPAAPDAYGGGRGAARPRFLAPRAPPAVRTAATKAYSPRLHLPDELGEEGVVVPAAAAILLLHVETKLAPSVSRFWEGQCAALTRYAAAEAAAGPGVRLVVLRSSAALLWHGRKRYVATARSPSPPRTPQAPGA